MSPSNIHRQPNASGDPRPTLRYGDRIGDYIVNGFAGTGATSFVYRARHQESFEPVAIKVLHPRLLKDQIKRRRFLREAEMMMGFRHPNVVEFREIIDSDEHLAFVMEYIDGQTLSEWQQDEGIDADEMTLACLFVDILRGLNHAHRRGVVHRDLKPANILITFKDERYVAKIIDFGVARFADQPTPPEDKKKIVGTAAYISPEEVQNPDGVCAASDLYSIGVMLYEASCGRRPFENMAVRDLMNAHVSSQPTSPRHHNPALSSGFESVILRTLSKSPDRRFDSAPEMIGALEMAIYEMMEAEEEMGEEDEAFEEATTMEWSRAQRQEARHVVLFLRQCFLFAFTALMATGARGGDDDPHHLSRADDLTLPFP